MCSTCGKHGQRQPERGVEPRPCESCGALFQPYRASFRTCSKRCYRQLPEVREANSWRKMQPEARARKNERRRVATDPERRRAENLRQNLARYGLTPAEHAAMLERQGGVCAICGDPPRPGTGPATRRLHVDHDHDTGRVRGLLCNNCNRGIGYFQDDEVRLMAAVQYLKET